MTALETLLEALKVYEIEVTAVEGTHVKIQNNYEVEVEKNKLYKLLDDQAAFYIANGNKLFESSKIEIRNAY